MKPLLPHISQNLGLKIEEHSYILNYLGALLVIVGLLMLLPLVPYWLYDEVKHQISPLTFILPALISVVLGVVTQKNFSYKTPSVMGAMVITALGWILVGVIGSFPYMLGMHKPFIDAFFESVSCFTTTGITVFEGLDSMPRCILFWRSFTQWLGGLGILSFFIAVSFRGGSTAAVLFSSEGHKIDVSRPVPGIFHTLKILWGIYGIFTLGSFLCFWAGGMSLFDALNHCFTCISTGGFSTHDLSFDFWSQHHFRHAWLLEYFAIMFMIAGGTNFLIHYKVFTGDPLAAFRDFEIKWYWGLLLGAVALIVINHLIIFSHHEVRNFGMLHHLFRTALFQVSSLITSTGYLTTDINASFFPALSKQVLLVLMIIGGCVGSTSGGIKVLRAALLSRLFSTHLRRLSLPRQAAVPLVISGKVISEAEIQRVAALFWSWMGIIVAGGFITAAFSDLDPWQSFSRMISAMGNMGPFYFSVHKMASLSWVVKFTYIMGMLAGRLEILPLAILFGAIFRRRKGVFL
ncbi:MAG: TrkH family potassium uptake protein [Deltaproteobacteria bacterium]|nr:MAG: TrkH family potassium uptake protein [Deltaproteobacteria bacterium]